MTAAVTFRTLFEVQGFGGVVFEMVGESLALEWRKWKISCKAWE